MDPRTAAALCLSLPGEWWECGVWRAGCSAELAKLIIASQSRPLRLFDTWSGRPAKTAEDTGVSDWDFTDCSLADAQQRVPHPFVSWHAGTIPESFVGLEQSRIAFAYLDMDLYRSTRDALAFIWPRMVPGGLVLLDDYLEPVMWPGVQRATDEFACAHGVAVHVSGRRAVLKACM